MVSRSRSRLSSSAVCNDPLHSDLPSRLGSIKDRPEARRRLGRNGQVFLDLDSSNSDSEECSETDMQLLPLADGYARRVTFSTGGAPPEQQQQQQQSDPAQLALPNGARLWRGAAASVCAGQRLQSLERHAAELKARQEVHTELKAWVEAVLTDSGRLQQQPDDAALGLDGDLPDPLTEEEEGEDLSIDHLQQQQHRHRSHHHRHHRHHHHAGSQQQQQQQQQQDGQEQQEGDAAAPRRHSHRHRRHHRHHHASAAGAGEQPDEAAEAEAAATQIEGRESVQRQDLPQQLVLVPTEGTPAQAAQWQQFNAAEQQLIAQMQQDQQLLLEQLQQAYSHIAALTAQQAATAATAAGSGAAGQVTSLCEQQEQPTRLDDEVLLPGPHTQVLVIRRSSSESEHCGPHQPPAAPAGSSQQPSAGAEVLEADPAAVQAEGAPAAPTRGSSSSCNTPRGRLSSRASTARQSDAAGGSSRRTPRAAAGKAQKQASTAAGTLSTTAADKAKPGSPRTPRKSLQVAQAAAAIPRPSLQVPTGRGLTLPQQQALVQRLQQAEEVMDLLQQDLQESLEAQQQLQDQVQLLQEVGTARRSAVGQVQGEADVGSEQVAAQQRGGSQGQQGEEGTHEGEVVEGQAGQPASLRASDAGVAGAEGQVGSETTATALQQLQEQLQEQGQQLAAAQEDAAGQQELIAELQQELGSRLEQEQQQVATISSLSEQLARAALQLHSLQQQQQVQHSAGGKPLHIPSMQEQHPQQPGTAAAEGPMCCQHEARCQQLQTVLQALLRQLQVHDSQASTHLLRPQTAAAQGSPRVRASWQHRPVELHTWLCPGPPQQPRPMTPRLAQPPQPYPAASAQAAQSAQAAAHQLGRSASVPRCSTATVSTSSSNTSPRPWARMAAAGCIGSSPRCNTSGPLTSRCCSGQQQQQHWQDSGGIPGMQPLEYKLRPLTYRGPDRAAAAAISSATGGRRQLSIDAQKGLLASLRVAPVCARGHGQGALQQPLQAHSNSGYRGAQSEALGDQPYGDVVQAGDAMRCSQEGTAAAFGSSMQLSPRRQQQGRSPRGGRGQGPASMLLDSYHYSRRGGVPRLVLTDLQ